VSFLGKVSLINTNEKKYRESIIGRGDKKKNNNLCPLNYCAPFDFAIRAREPANFNWRSRLVKLKRENLLKIEIMLN